MHEGERASLIFAYHESPSCDCSNRAGRDELAHLDKWNWSHVVALKRLDCSHDGSLLRARAINFK